jgi:drug/metabolite transporter (DMT)-like permease|tara:strand:+ start:404 stop:1312 length:909 start_codon:yes stop_codon:yes gene_type:complete
MDNYKTVIGIACTLTAVVFGLITGMLVKKVGTDVTVITTLFYRFLFSIPLLLIFAIIARRSSFLQINQKKTLFLRIIFGFSGITFWFLAVRAMPLGQATTLFQSSVIFVTLLSPVLLNEKVGRFRWTAVITGLIGIIIVTNPFSTSISFAVIYGILAAFSGAILAITLRHLGRSDSPTSIALWYNFSGAVIMAAVILCIPNQLSHIGGQILYDLILLGIVASVLQIFFTTAYKYLDAVVVSSLRYIQIPLAAIAGYLLFSENMSLNQIVGALIVISSCLVIAWREFVRKKIKHNKPKESMKC